MRHERSNRFTPFAAALVALSGAGGCGATADDGDATGAGGATSSGAGTSGPSSTTGGGATSSGGTTSGGGTTGSGGGATSGTGGGGAGGGGGQGSGGSGSGAGTGGGTAFGCPASALVGWAAESGHGVASTTGGLGGMTVTATNAEQLLEYAESPDPLIIQISGDIDISGLDIDVASHKTLIGADPSATLRGRLQVRGKSIDAPIQNVIIQNLKIDASSTIDDGIQIHFAHHVWVDHVEIWDGLDGNLDVVHGSDLVTISWCKFHYTNNAPDPAHRFSNLVGHSNNNSGEDTGRLRVSFHHNWWADNVTERMPRVRFGEVHVFNNYYSAAGNNYAIGGGLEARLRIENNYFDGVKDPHIFYEAEPTAQIVASGNTYIGMSDTTRKDTGQGAAFTPPYTVTLDTADASLKDVVTRCAGPR
ncbi:pectate lyase family protein [Sorangium sp. So ce233]|uniref:pectate lyase family protein n=1 Tax=Sorangium sp. So ce233 TaxID=3133290 RepID=UPI003F62BDA0